MNPNVILNLSYNYCHSNYKYILINYIMGHSFSTTNYTLQYSIVDENIHRNTPCCQKIRDICPIETCLFTNNNAQYIYKENTMDSPKWLYIKGDIDNNLDMYYYCIYYIDESKLLKNSMIFNNFNELSKYILTEKTTSKSNDIIRYQTNINTSYMNELV